MMQGIDTRLSAYEEFRIRAEEIAMHVMTLEMYETRHTELVHSVDEVRTKFAEYLAEQSGRSSGIHSSTTLMLAIPAIVSALVGTIVAVIAFFA